MSCCGLTLGLVVSAVAFVGYLLSILLSKPPKVVEVTDDAMAEIHKERYMPKKLPPEEEIDAIVVGSGIGGMSCASVLAQNGYRVLVLEQHDKLGGCTHTFPLSKQNLDGSGEYTKMEFDTGMHYVSVDTGNPTRRSGALMSMVTDGRIKFTDLGPVWDSVLFPAEEIPEAAGGSNSPRGADDQFVLVKDGKPACEEKMSLPARTYQFRKGRKAVVEEIANQIGGDQPLLRERIARFLDFSYKAQKSLVYHYMKHVFPRWMEPFISFLDADFFRYGKLTTAYVMNAIFDFGFTDEEVLAGKPIPMTNRLSAENKKKSPVRSTLSEQFRQAKGALVHPIGDYACQPSDSSIVAHSVTAFYYMTGAAYTIGPTQGIAQSAARIVTEAGGKCLTQARVTEILLGTDGAVAGVRVQPASSSNKAPVTVRCKTVINATGVYNLYENLLPQNLPLVKQFKDERTFRQSYGHNFLFVTLKGDAEDIGLPRTNGWYINGYDTDDRFDEYFKDPESVRPPTVYLGFPCTKDVTWKERYPGYSNCILISDAKYEWYEKWEGTHQHRRGDDYEAFKKKLSERMLAVLYDKVPSTKGKVLWHDLGTPLSDTHYLGSYKAGSYGTRCNVNYFSKASERWLMRGDTEISGLYLAGQDAFCPAVMGACYGGFMGAMKVMGPMRTIAMWMRLVWNMSDELMKLDPKLNRLSALVKAKDNLMD